MFKEHMGRKTIIGLIHVFPMPNTPFYKQGDVQKSIDKAKRDALSLQEGGAHGCLIQTVDRVYDAEDETDSIRIATMSVIVNEVKKVVQSDFIVGVQLMWNNITPSLAVAKATGADFTRCTALVGTTDSQFGVVVANPLKVMNYRKSIDAESVALIAEITGYHNQSDTNDENLLNHANQVINVGADAIEIYHKDEIENERLARTLKAAYPQTPIVLGGGTDIDNVARRMKYADIALVGSCFENGEWGGDIDSKTVSRYMDALSRK